MNKIDKIKKGDKVQRTEGRAEHVGRFGVVVAVHGVDGYGVGGDVGITVRESDGSEFFCYTRQVVRCD